MTDLQRLSPLYLLLFPIGWGVLINSYIGLANLPTQIGCLSLTFGLLLCGSLVMVAYHPIIHLLDLLTPEFIVQDTVPITQSRVAILYTVRNDFDSVAFRSCVQTAQQLGGRVYVLDDSKSNPIWENEVDWSKDGEFVTIVRRYSSQGFKAGNINDAIRTQSLYERYDYIILADADEILSPKAAKTLVATLDANPEIAFVQLAHISREDQKSWFARIMGVMTDVKYRYYRKYTNRYGLPLSHGHGVAIRLSLLKNGFPEILSEDIALSIDLRLDGYRGVFLTQPLCQESVVDSIAAFWRRERRCIAADVECFGCKTLPAIFSQKMGVIEKWDLFIREIRYPIKLLYPLSVLWSVLYLVLVGEHSGSAGGLAGGLAGGISKTCWVAAALVPWASYFRFLGFRRFFTAVDFLFVSLSSHIGCMVSYLEGGINGLWRVFQRYKTGKSCTDRIWIPAGTKNLRIAPLLNDIPMYLVPGFSLVVIGAIFSHWELALIGICLVFQWGIATSLFSHWQELFVTRITGFGVILALLIYIISPTPSYVSDLLVVSLAVILF